MAYVSGLLNLEAPDGDLFMDSELARRCRDEGELLLRRFKTVAFESRQSIEGKNAYRDWFLISSQDKSLPIRAGYCAGLVLIRRMAAANISVQEMASWKFVEIPERLKRFIN